MICCDGVDAALGGNANLLGPLSLTEEGTETSPEANGLGWIHPRDCQSSDPPELLRCTVSNERGTGRNGDSNGSDIAKGGRDDVVTKPRGFAAITFRII